SSSGSVFVGRIVELGILADALAHVRKGHSASVVLSGESGVGKSALVRQFTEALRGAHPDAVLFSGRCFERESVKYKAVDDVVDDISRFAANLSAATVAALVPAQARLLSSIFPVLANVDAFREAPEAMQEELVPREMRIRVFAALRELLCRIAERWLLVVSVDDLQWADPDSRALLDAVLRPPNAPPLLFLATLRTGTEYGRGGAPFELPGDVRYIQVEKLPSADAEELAARLTGRTGMADAEARAIAREAGGHPLFIDELIRRRTRGEQGAPAMRLDDALWARVGELGASERKVIELLAVAGLPIPYDVAAAAASLSLGELFDAVATLRATKLARTDGARRVDVVDTYHDRVRGSVLAHLEPAERKTWHGRLALAFEEKQGANPETLAVHWQGAGEPARAAGYAERAADEAARSLAFDRASRLYRTALAQCGESGEARKTIELRMADALTNAGRSFDAAEARMDLARARDDLQAIDQRRIAAEQYLTSGHFAEGIATLRAVIAQMDLHFPRSPLTAILLMVFYRLMLRFRGLSIAESPESAEPDRRRMLQTDCTWSAASGLLMTDNVMGAYFQTRALLQSLRLGAPGLACRAFCMEALAAGAPDRARSEDLLARARPLAEKVGTQFVRALVAAADGGTAYFWGEWERAAPLLIEAEGRFREHCLGVTFELNSLRMMLFRVLAYVGDLKALERRAGAVLEEAEARQDRYAIINTRAVALCTLHMAADAPELAERELSLIRAQLPAGKFLVQHYLHAFAQGQLDLYAGRPAKAYAEAAVVWKALKRAFLLRVPLIRIMTRDLRARGAIGAARIDRAQHESLLALAEADACELEREPFAWAHSLAQLLHGQIALARGRRDEAHRALTLAVAALDGARMPVHAAAARMALAGTLAGAEERTLVAEAEATIRACSFVRSERAIAMLAPGR
ncbi:MAG TPA: AAA family ATPase, partial [Polyangiaceae bacterium]